MTSAISEIKPKPCSYNCGIQIYWNTSTGEYWEVFARKKHVCPNRSVTQSTTSTNTSVNRPFYSKKVGVKQQKMSNSLELLSGPISEIQKKYEILSDIVSEYGGKVHGSQSHVNNGNIISLVVYYEIPEGKREEVKQKVLDLIKNFSFNN